MSVEAAVQATLRKMAAYPLAHLVIPSVLPRNDDDRSLAQILKDQAENLAHYLQKQFSTHLTPSTTIDDPQTSGIVMSAPAASPHTDVSLQQIMREHVGQHDETPPYAPHIIVWWDVEETKLDHDLLRLSPQQHAAFFEVIARHIDEAKRVLKNLAKKRDLQEGVDYSIEIYGLTGYANITSVTEIDQSRTQTGLGRGSQSAPLGHFNVVLRLTESGRKKLNLVPLPKYAVFKSSDAEPELKRGKVSKRIQHLAKITDALSKLPHLTGNYREAFLHELENILAQSPDNYQINIDPENLELLVKMSEASTEEKITLAAYIAQSFNNFQTKLYKEYEMYWRQRIIGSQGKTADVDAWKFALFSGLHPSKKQLEVWKNNAEDEEKSKFDKKIKRYEELQIYFSTLLSNLIGRITECDDEEQGAEMTAEAIKILYLLDSVRSESSDEGLPDRKNEFAQRFSSVIHVTDEGISIGFRQGQKAAVEDYGVIDRENGSG
ncbi:MAG: hypothetical protein H6774_02160 [Pseudomonadales bacterium]|nr:hypothetical protein [Candidatus Woesebacteria bacterium]MCB9801871.1 hypothetical protein [Pseudomonadales bacterium]